MTYGAEPEFRRILEDYSENIIPIIDYFVHNDPLSLRLTHAAWQEVQAVQNRARGLWHWVTGAPQVQAAPMATAYGSTERGWHAIHKIRQDGHDFLGQFVIGQDKRARWIQTARLLNEADLFLTSGIRTLETKYVLDQEIHAADLLWAGVDVAGFVSVVKLWRVGKVLTRSGKQLSLTQRTMLVASRMFPKGGFARQMLKYGGAAGVLYIVIKHPGLLNGILAETAKAVGLHPLLLQITAWTLLIFTLSCVCFPVLRGALALGIRALSLTITGLRTCERLLLRAGGASQASALLAQRQ
jgi:hypothetical protein